MSNIKNPIICAIDTKEISLAKNYAEILKPYIGTVKLGLEFFTKNGPAGVEDIHKTGVPIFLDLKYYDIPNTVAHATRAAVQINASIVTIHTSGGMEMMKAAADAAKSEAERNDKKRPLIIGVTVLTSMDDVDVHDLGVSGTVRNQVKNLALLARESGLDGVVCSAYELELIKKECGKDFITIVPGIRPAGTGADDQKRVMMPSEAIELGADYLVIGRPITQSEDPAETAKDILKEISYP